MASLCVRSLLVLAIGLLLPIPAGAQDILFERITTNYTNCIMRDADGFVWIGTQDGLLRYDGNDFRAFRNDPGDSLSLSNNFVWSLLQDARERIWIGTFGGGLSMWDTYTERFQTFYCAPPGTETMEVNTIRSIATYDDSTLVLGTEHGVWAFNTERKQFLSEGLWDDLRAKDWFTYAVTVLPGKALLVASENGLFHVDLARKAVALVDVPGDDTQTITDLLRHQDTIYVGSEYGLYVTTDLHSFDQHLTRYHQPATRIGRIYRDHNGVIWLATEEGLARFQPTEGYHWFRADISQPASLRTNIVHCVAEVEPDVLMAGTRQGVHLFTTEPPLFHSVVDPAAELGCSRAILGMTEDHNGNIWICSRQGLMFVRTHEDLAQWSAECYHTSTTPGMLNDYTLNITRDDNNDLWLAYRANGFSRIRVVDQALTWHQYPKTVALFDGEGVNQIFQDAAGHYWIATRGFGLMQFFPEADSVKRYGREAGLSHPYIFRIYEDSQQRMWIATANGGLCQFDREQERFTCYVLDRNKPYSISSNMVLAVSEDSKQRLWVCTVDRLNIMEAEEGVFTVISTVDGLPNNVVYAALEVPDSTVWLSTNEGIVRMRFDGGIRSMDLFDTRDGLPGPEFNQHAFLKHSSGLLLFGGTDGFTVFDPLAMRASNYHPPIALTGFYLFNDPVPVSPGDRSTSFALDTNINDLQRIVLKHNQNTLAFQYSALGYAHRKIASYAYMMEGLDEQWVTLNNSRYVSYPRIAPGLYTFKVNISNRNGDWNPEPKSVEIHILPPPWKTWWAYTIYVILLLSMIYAIVWFQSEKARAIERAKATERDRFRNKMARDFHDESGSKITILTLISDRLSNSVANTGNQLQLVRDLQKNIQELREGMRDFIWIMDPGQDTLFDTILRFRDFAARMCKQADVRFIENGRVEALRDVEVSGHIRRHILLILREGLNNSLKYAAADEIQFSINKVGAQWVIVLQDDGMGFDQADITPGHGLGNMQHRAQQIGAVLAITSRPARGTRIELQWSDNNSSAVRDQPHKLAR
ncbi:MAG: two-component regulator propeller domain-containing protein [Saprospiraceae bacterium]|nr:two-component regulator propeller domain-containing protein [Saprospiraceae bacterium]